MKQFYQDLAKNQPSPVYLFYGDETLLIEDALAALARFFDPEDCGWNREQFDGEEATPAQVALAASAGSLFGGQRLLVAKNIGWLEKKERKQAGEGKKPTKKAKATEDETASLLAYINDPNPQTCLALTARGNVDSRRKLVQLIQKKGRLIECSTPKGMEKDNWILQRFVEAGFQAERRAVAYIGLSATNLLQMSAEVDKLCLYCAGKREVTLADAEALVSKNIQNRIFDLTDAAATKNAATALASYRQLRLQGEDAGKILARLSSHFRSILLVQDMLAGGERPADIAATLSLHPFVVEKCGRACRVFSQRQLIKAMEILLAADIAQKSGQGDLDDLLEIAILRICAM